MMALHQSEQFKRDKHNHRAGYALAKKRGKKQRIASSHSPTTNNDPYNETTIKLKTYPNRKSRRKPIHTKHKRPRSVVLNIKSDDESKTRNKANTTQSQTPDSADISRIISFYNQKDTDAKRVEPRRRRRKPKPDHHIRAKTTDISDVVNSHDIFANNDDDDATESAQPSANHRRRRRRNKPADLVVNSSDNHFRSQTSVKDIAGQLNTIIDQEAIAIIQEKRAAKRRHKRTKKRPNSATFADADKTDQSFFPPSINAPQEPVTPPPPAVDTNHRNHRHAPPRPKPKKKTKEDIAKTFKKGKTKRKVRRPLSATFGKSHKFFPSNTDDDDTADNGNKRAHKSSFFGFNTSSSSSTTPRKKKSKKRKGSKKRPPSLITELDDDEEKGPKMLPLKHYSSTPKVGQSNLSKSFAAANTKHGLSLIQTAPSKPQTACGYIESLPTSKENHGRIYHARYGLVVFKYEEAIQTAHSMRRATDANYANARHLGLPSSVPSASADTEDSKESSIEGDEDSDGIDRLFVYQPVEFEIEPDKNEDICDIEQENRQQKVVIAKLKNYQKESKNRKKYRTKSNIFSEDEAETQEQERLNGIRNGFISERRSRKAPTLDEDEDVFVMPEITRTRAGHVTSGAAAPPIMPGVHTKNTKKMMASSVPNPKMGFSGPNPSTARVNKLIISESKSVSTEEEESDGKKHKRNKYKRPKGLVLDCDPSEEAEIHNNNNDVVKVTNVSKVPQKPKNRVRKRNALSDTLNRARLMKLNQQRLKKKQRRMKSSADQTRIAKDDSVIAQSNLLALAPSVSSLTFSAKKRQRIAMNVRTKDEVNDDNVSLYCFTPKGKHYYKMSLDTDSSPRESPTSPQTTSPTPRKLKIIKSGPRKIRRAKTQRRLKKQNSFDFRNFGRHKGSSSKSFDKGLKQQQLTQFCPSSSQYYVRDSCLLHWEGKNIQDINPDGAKKMDTNKLGLKEEKKAKKELKPRNDLFFSMETDVESICDELEEKINRLFNNDGGTIYVGVKEMQLDEMEDNNEETQKEKPNSFSLTRKKMTKQKHVKPKVPLSIRSRIICGIELNSKMRFELKNTIINEIVKGFTPQIPHLLNNFFLKFIPVVSQRGKIVSSCFVIKVTVFAPILGENGEKMQFRTKDGYCHMIDFDF